jgi:asparagine synthase (glutamine-hydrolysing)
LFDDVIDAFGEPFGDYSAFPTMLVSRLAREHVTVALAGDGGDELFFGYPRMWSMRQWRRLFALPPLARRGIRKALSPFAQVRPPEGTTLGSIGRMFENMHSEFGGARLGEVAPGLGQPPADFRLYELNGMPGADALAQWTRRVEIQGHLEKTLMKVDRASMHESLEVRVPLLDHDLVKVALGLAPEACMNGKLGKLPLRRELASLMPEGLISLPKSGFGVPMGDWLRVGLADRFQERVLEKPVLFGGAFDPGVVQEIVNKHRAGEDWTQQLWNLLSLQEWADRHLRVLP